MHHTHLKETSSTQEEVKKALQHGPGPFLVSTDNQKAGIGRQGSQWVQFEDALAFSFNIKPNEQMTLTPLEIGILLAKFFGPKVYLKWPNDLLNKERAKVGGILCQLVGETIVVGVGINLKMKKGQKEQNNFPYPVSGIFQDLEDLDPHIKKSLPLEIFNFINQNRLSATKVREEFLKYCVHKNQEVTIKDSKASFTGEFIGITKEGAAILKDSNDKQHEVLSGSLFL